MNELALRGDVGGPSLPYLHPGLPYGSELLVKKTMFGLRRYFADKNHKPSPAMWAALTDLASTLANMATGIAPPRLFLSSLDPGVGKTQTISHFVDALLSDLRYSNVGVILCVGRLNEVRDLIHNMAVPAETLSVLTSDNELNQLGKATVNDAQVLITTQQRIEKVLTGASFNASPLFFYHGKVRSVRIWDESYLPGQTITLNNDDIAKTFGILGPSWPDLRKAVLTIFNEVDQLPDGAIYQFPDFVPEHGVDLNDVLARTDNNSDSFEHSILSSLWFLSGKTVTVRKDGVMGNTALDYRDTLPDDLAPMVILDASGRVRETYRDIEEGRGTLCRLREANKLYDHLAVHLWQTGGGKQAFRTSGDKLVAGIAKTINTKPNEPWLVVHHKDSVAVGDVEQAVRELLTGPQENVSFITWGKHQASNEYVDVRNVILAGTLFYRPSYYEALARLGSGKGAIKGPVSKDHLERVTAGEHAHAILQALCRGAVRRCDGEHCHPCDAYIIASVRSGIASALPKIFPGCTVERWQPIDRPLKGHVKAAVDYLADWAANPDSHPLIQFSTVAKALEMSRQDFRNDVRLHPDFRDAIAELGLVETGSGKRRTGFLRF